MEEVESGNILNLNRTSLCPQLQTSLGVTGELLIQHLVGRSLDKSYVTKVIVCHYLLWDSDPY